ncbi:TetR/AcrR family transcriptional regulator [Streptomyces sp. NPDC087263]|uniref:TetR/AcrR family transcriptional regulator n=1 Tax=Streptomyces sp. NPDC087263 TaxID=3365773 RepID=UPI003821A11D
MQDVLKEVDLSAGAVYRYFSGKEELIGAIVTEVLDEVRDTFEEGARQSPPPPPEVLVGWVLAKMLDKRPGLTDEGASILPRLIIQVWAETLRNDHLSTVINDGYAKVGGGWIKVVEAYLDAGVMRDDVAPESVARIMIAPAQGYLAQMALFASMPVSTLQDGLRGLMSMGNPARGRERIGPGRRGSLRIGRRGSLRIGHRGSLLVVTAGAFSRSRMDPSAVTDGSKAG